MVRIKDLFFLLLFLALSMIISYRIKNISTKNGNSIEFKSIGGIEILLIFLIWNLQYDFNSDTANGSINMNNLNLYKTKIA
ncbi:SIMPL domain-containing protein [Borreliella turdi]|uniref:SIMPL domain-containing protein n=1 Tax=Borreliella turdi TaxID=57863 RepID=UPI001245FC9C|nr:SIMPL domain-containing protein [Borreliella turdi]